MKLQGSVALITGGTSGIGMASALLFAKEGAKVAIAARSRMTGEALVKEIKSHGQEAIFVETDVSKSMDAKNMVKKTVESFDRLDILFNNAGIGIGTKSILDTTEEDWDRVIDVNLKGVFLGCKFAVPQMLRQKKGIIINTASEVGLVGAKNHAAYCASKGGIIQLTRALALEVADKNIRVNCLCPGVTLTPMLQRSIMNSPNPEEAKRRIVELEVPLRRIAAPEEIAKAALFLASDDSSFMTGATLVIDGGAIA